MDDSFAKAETLRSMDEVKLRRKDLLAKVVENRTKHIAAYDKAVEVYRKAAVAVLEEGKAEIEKQIQQMKDGKRSQIGDVSLWLPSPTNHVDTYNRVITMLEMSVDEFILLPEDQFSQVVMDRWGWSGDFIKITRAYAGAQGFQGSVGAGGNQGWSGPSDRTESISSLRKNLQ